MSLDSKRYSTPEWARIATTWGKNAGLFDPELLVVLFGGAEAGKKCCGGSCEHLPSAKHTTPNAQLPPADRLGLASELREEGVHVVLRRGRDGLDGHLTLGLRLGHVGGRLDDGLDGGDDCGRRFWCGAGGLDRSVCSECRGAKATVRFRRGFVRRCLRRFVRLRLWRRLGLCW